MRPVLAVGVLVLVLGACQSGSSPTASIPSTTGAPAPSSVGGCAPFHGTTARAESVGKRPVGLLIDAVAGVLGCLDQVTFTFQSLGDGTPPGYVVEYQTEPFLNGDPPHPVTIEGKVFLSVVMAPAASVDVTKPDQPMTYLGNLLLQYHEHHHLMVVEKLDDWPGTIRWVIALDTKRPFVVDSAADPARITVYIG